MKTFDRRDIVITSLFGAPSAWLYAYLMDIWNNFTAVPLLNRLLQEGDTEQLRTWATTYASGLQILGSVICALFIALPLGYLLRGRHVVMAALFALLFVGGIATSILVYQYTDPASLLIFILSSAVTVVFLACSMVFIVIGHFLR